MSEKSDRKKQKNSRLIRLGIMGSVLIVSTYLGLAHQFSFFGWTPPGVDALCPFGALESGWELISSGGYLPKIAVSSLILFVGVILTWVASRRGFCGQYCPLGTLQELVGNLGRKILGKRWLMPKWLDKPARYLKYGILLGVLILSWAFADLVLRPLDPWVAFHHLSSDELLTDFAVGFGILVLSLAGSFFYDRFFCKYLCPMGAALAPVARFSPVTLARSESTCIDCKACDKACPMNISVSTVKKVVSPECIDCGLCVNACPVKETLEYKAPGGKSFSPLVLTLLVAGVMAGTTLAGSLAGWFNWSILSLEEEQTVAKVEAVEQGIEVPDFDPALIKGRDSFKSISETSGVSKADFMEKFVLAEEDFNKPVKDAVAKYGTFLTDDIRGFVAEKLGLPPPPAEGH